MKKNPYTPGTKRARLYDLLRDHRWHPMGELLHAGGFRYGGRLLEMREDGLDIEVKRDTKKPNLYHYRLPR